MKYIKFLHIINFQSHLNTKIELDPGLNIFTGESDQGKTSIIRALRWLFYNEPRGTGFIRVGETRCEVTAIFNDGTKVSRLRDETKRQNRYIVYYPDGREEPELILERFKNEVPLEVQQELGVFPLWIDTDHKLELNIAQQLDPPFLIADSAASRAKTIGRIANLHIIDAAQRELLRDVRSQSREKSDLELEIEKLEEEKETFNDLPEQEKKLQQVRILLEKTENSKSLANILGELLKQRKDLLTNIEKNSTRLEKLVYLEKISKINESLVEQAKYYTNLIQVRNKLHNVTSELNKYNNTINKLVNIENAANNYTKLLDLEKTLRKLIKLKVNRQENATQLEKVNKHLNSTDELPRVQNIISQLYDLRQRGNDLQQVKKISRQLSRDIRVKEKDLAKIKQKLESLQGIQKAQNALKVQTENLTTLKRLTELNLHAKQNQQKIDEQVKEITLLGNKYEEIQTNFIEILNEAGTCPTCGSQITPIVIEKIADKTAI